MKPFLNFIVLAILLLSASTACRAQGELGIIRRQYAEAILRDTSHPDALLSDFTKEVKPEHEVSDQIVQELSRLYPLDTLKIAAYLKQQNADGSWADINYADTRRSSWSPRTHAERTLELAKLYQSHATPYYHNARIREACLKAANFWAKANIRCKNWWYNEIGMPKTLGDAYILMRDEMSDNDVKGAVKVLSVARISRTGQNKVWLAGIVLVRAILQNDTTLARKAREALLEQIVLGQKEGIQPDWSFHQHGPQQQFGNYGLAFLSDMSFYAKIFRNTSFALSHKQEDILNNLLNQGYRWIIWNRRMDVSAVDRQLFHNAQINKAYSVAFSAQNLKQPAFFSQGNHLTGHKHFSFSDYTIHRTSSWMASLKMASNRVIGTERVNEDNLKGFYLADGATFFYVRGDEYENIFPLWNWTLIPGTTAPNYDSRHMPQDGRDDARNHSNQVGGLTLGSEGCSAMELNRLGTHARKFWLFTDQFVVCMGSGIRTDSAAELHTCVDQSNAAGPVYYATTSDKKRAVWNELENKKIILNAPTIRLFHNHIGYVIVNAETEIAHEYRQGDWRKHMGSYNPFPAQGHVVQTVIRHGHFPKESGKETGTYLYIVMPNCKQTDVAQFDLKKEIKVWQNDDHAQILSVKENPNTLWIVAYEVGTYRVGKQQINIDAPGIYAFNVKKNNFAKSMSF